MPLKILKCILIFIGTMIFATFLVEWYLYTQELRDLAVFVDIAGRASLEQQQDLYLGWDTIDATSSNANKNFAALSEEAINEIKATMNDSYLRKQKIEQYTDELEIEFRNNGIKDGSALDYSVIKYYGIDKIKDYSRVYYYLDFISGRAAAQADSHSGIQGSTYNPIQFGLSYIDEDVLRIVFEDNVRALIDANYVNDINNGANPLRERLSFRTADVMINDLKVIDLTNNSSSDSYRLFAQLYGKELTLDNYEDLYYYKLLNKNTGGSDSISAADLWTSYDALDHFAVEYTVTFRARGWHNTLSPLLAVNDERTDKSIWGYDEDSLQTYESETGDLGRVRIHRIAGRPYLSFAMPEITQTLNYTLTN